MGVVEFVVFGIPVSLQTTSKRTKDAWKLRVASARSSILEEDVLLADGLNAVLIYFHHGTCGPDIDNIAKPILDAAAGIAFAHNSLLAQVIVRRTQLEGLEVESPTAPLAAALAQAVSEVQNFVYVRISDAPIEHGRIPRVTQKY